MLLDAKQVQFRTYPGYVIKRVYPILFVDLDEYYLLCGMMIQAIIVSLTVFDVREKHVDFPGNSYNIHYFPKGVKKEEVLYITRRELVKKKGNVVKFAKK